MRVLLRRPSQLAAVSQIQCFIGAYIQGCSVQMNQRTRTALEDIVEGAKILGEHDFTGHAISIGRGFRASRINDQEWEIEFDLPDNQPMNATVLTLRLFLLFGEDYSFHRLDRLATDPQLSPDFSAALLQIRRSYFGFLNTSPQVSN